MKKFFTPYSIFMILILLLSVILRFWKVPGLFYFGIDEEYQATYAATITRDFHLIWIGVSAADTGYYLGPGFTYLNAALFWLSHNDPIILGFFSALLGVCTTFSVYYISNELYNNRISLTATTFYGLSTLMVFYDKRFWNPSLVPFISIWLVFSLIKAIKNPVWLVLTSILIASSYHSHITLWLYWPFILGTIIYIWKRITIKVWLLSFTSFITIYSPLIVFDKVHNFDNVLMPFRMLKKVGHGHSFELINHVRDIFIIIGRLWYIHPFSNVANEAVPTDLVTKSHTIFIIPLLIISMLIFLLFKQKNYSTKLIISIIFIFLLSFSLYPGKVDEYYLLGIFPLLFIVIAVVLNDIRNSAIVGSILIIFSLLNIFSVITSSTLYGLTTKKYLIQKVSHFLQNKDFYLTSSGTYRSYAGWRYLFKIYGKTPGQSQTDSMFGWLYPDEIKSEKPKTILTITDDVTKQSQSTFVSGGFSALLNK